MNLRKIKLDLTVNLLNKQSNKNVIQTVQDLMNSLKADVGNFIGSKLLSDFGLNKNLVKRTYSMQYEHCTLNVDVVLNPHTSNQYINGFSFN